MDPKIEWLLFPQSLRPPAVVEDVVWSFQQVEAQVDSYGQNDLKSDDVLRLICPFLQERGFEVETGKKRAEKIYVPVLYGMNGRVEKHFDADAVDRDRGLVLEVEAGRGIANNQFLKDLFQACMMKDIDYLAIALRRIYRGGNRNSQDFETARNFFETLYASQRLKLPLKGILLIGY